MTAENEAEDNESRPPSMHLPNAEWREADRLGRLLLEHLDEQDERRRQFTLEIPTQGEDQ